MIAELWPIDAFLSRGAEADLYKTKFLGEDAVLKLRIKKDYRNDLLDRAIRTRRTSREVAVLNRAKRAGLRVPFVRYVDAENCLFVMEYLNGTLLRKALINGEVEWRDIAARMGEDIALIHDVGVVHGDLTTSNVMIADGDLAYFDFGLGEISMEVEKRAVDLELLYRVMHSTHPEIEKGFFRIFTDEYVNTLDRGFEVVKRYRSIRRMGRYVPREKRKKP